MLKEKRLFLLDMDGTIYIDNSLFDGTVDFLAHIRSIGGRYIFLTNNSSKSADKYVEKLAMLGIASSRSDFITSTDAAVAYIKKNYPGMKIYALGTASFRSQLIEAGFDITDKLEDGIGCLIMGYDTELTFRKLEDACILLGKGVEYVATNPDRVCPTWYGYVPDCGSVSEMLYNATGRRPYFIGKPQPDMVNMAISVTGFAHEQTVLLGDRLYTDITSGVNAGIDTVLVLSGESVMGDVDKSVIKPNYIFDNIKELLHFISV